ncbi:conserved protein of unknown function [Tepidibacter aestuarii]|nr:conserved protein of unknown function [Tepidibacter aestuarii]
MSTLEGMRLVNIHANNNNIIYTDEWFKINGKNTLIDMKNGGGKTLAAQMLFQTILPNSYFSDKNPIINLFNNVQKGSAIHCISHFSVEGMQFRNIYLGFTAMLKPRIDDNEEAYEELGSLKYMNYIIFGDNLAVDNLSIDTLPLSKTVSGKFQASGYDDLKKYLQNKMRSDNHNRKYIITVFENRKTPYYNELKKYGINSEVFELLKEINKDENYIKQFFEENCKTPRELLSSFIIPNTEKALDSRNFIMEVEKINKSHQLAESLYEKSQSLNKLNTFHSDKSEYEKLKNSTIDLIEYINSNKGALISFDNHLREYPKQTAMYKVLIDNKEESIRGIQSKKIELNNLLDKLKEEIENIEIREIRLKYLEFKEKLEYAQKVLQDNIDEIEYIKTQYRRLEATNQIIDYKRYESNKIKIDERLEKLTNVYYDELKSVSEYANTVLKLCKDSLDELKNEKKKSKSDLKDKNEYKDKLIELGGELKTQIKNTESEIINYDDEVNMISNENNKLIQELRNYPCYSGVLIDADEYEAVDKFIDETLYKIDKTEKDINSIKNEIESKNIEVAKLSQNFKNTKEKLEEKNEYWNKYLDSLENVKSNVGIDESDFKDVIKEKKQELKNNTEKKSILDNDKHILQDEIDILEDYGFLRSRSKYDALNYLKGDWKYAEFGSELLKNYTEEKVENILSVFPGFPEILVVSDEDYELVRNGKKQVNLSIAKENLVLMSRSLVNNLDELTFDNIYLLTPNKQYYKALLDSKVAIEDRTRKIRKIESLMQVISEEEDILENQINILTQHIARYPKNDIVLLEKNINELNEEIVSIKNKITIEENCITDLKFKNQNQIDKKEVLEDALDKAKIKKEILIKKIEITKKIDEIYVELSVKKNIKVKYEKELTSNKSNISLVESEIENILNIIKRLDDNINEKNIYAQKVDKFTNAEYATLESFNIEEMFNRFKEAREEYDIESQNYGDLCNKQKELEENMDEIKQNFKVKEFGFEILYGENYIGKIKNEEFISMEIKLKNLEDIKSNLQEKRNDVDSDLKMISKQLKDKEQNKTVYYEKFDELNKEELKSIKKEAKENTCRIESEMKKLISKEKEKKEKLEVLKSEFNKYEGFCHARQLSWADSICAVDKIIYNEMNNKYEKLKNEYERSMNKINTRIKQLESNIQKLNINVQVKQKLKHSLLKKNSIDEINSLVNLLEQAIKNVDTTIENIEVSIQNIGKLDKEIAMQVYRMLETILNEVAKIPDYSKFKYGEYTKPSFIINLTEKDGCRVEQDIAINRIKSYIYDLANRVQSEDLTKKDIKNKLSIKNLLHFGIDFDKLQIKILKIEEGKPKYYNWGRLSASSGQGYVTYVMFAITMIKYYNNVTQIRERTKSHIFIFLDNPFASASSLELWEPVRRFLDKSNAQLLCVAHNVPSSAQILFDKHILIEQKINSKGQYINIIRNEKTEAKEIVQMNLLDHLNIE